MEQCQPSSEEPTGAFAGPEAGATDDIASARSLLEWLADGRPQTFLECRDLLIVCMRRRVVELEDAIAHADRPRIYLHIYKLHGIAGTSGLADVGRGAERIVRACSRGADMATLAGLARELSMVVACTCEALAEIRAA